jgi:hypothetical protein
MAKKVYLCYCADDGIEEGVGEGDTLKAAYENYAEYHDTHIDQLLFMEAERIDVEFKIERKPVVTKVAAKTPTASKACP